MSETIPAEVLHQLYRGYCIAQFPYTPGTWATEEGQQSRIDYDARSYYQPGEDESDGHVGPLAELVKAAYAAGRESVLHEQNDIEATGRCCCNGCIGQGQCDLYDPHDADERAENDAERIAEMTPQELAGWHK